MKIAQSFFKNNKATDLWKIYMAYKPTVSGRRREDVDIRPTGIIKKEKIPQDKKPFLQEREGVLPSMGHLQDGQ